MTPPTETPPCRHSCLPPCAALLARRISKSLTMAEAIPADEQTNYETFRDCLSEPVLKALAAPDDKAKPKKKRHAKKTSKYKNGTVIRSKEQVETPIISTREARQSDAEDLGEFIEVHHTSLTYPRQTANVHQVPQQHHIPQPPHRAPHPHISQTPRFRFPPRHILHAPRRINIYAPPRSCPPRCNRQPRIIRPAPQAQRRHQLTQLPPPRAQHVHHSRNSAAAYMDYYTHD